ncbi:hypothetical protein ALP79_200087 [Pseudomonas savastanoi pv. fraxini]|nr:hypothetical protein ALP79_200087 [Pseudomonas savastanoi pv. fraxini]RMR63948.1 hypothetical protein ALP81_200089 [Pseudomonas savastanoi pv. fraxini]RMR76686.1 hypothetical protein ALP80_200120 [Pseudomonas savastanoi pv. fraxini]
MKALTPLSDFEHGFVTAAALAARLGDPNLAPKMHWQCGLPSVGLLGAECGRQAAVIGSVITASFIWWRIDVKDKS